MVSVLGMAFEVVENLVNSEQRNLSVAPIVSFLHLSVSSLQRAERQQPLQNDLSNRKTSRTIPLLSSDDA